MSPVSTVAAGESGLFGVKIDRFKTSLFYDGLRFSASDVSSGYYQPKSTEDVYGIKAGMVF